MATRRTAPSLDDWTPAKAAPTPLATPTTCPSDDGPAEQEPAVPARNLVPVEDNLTDESRPPGRSPSSGPPAPLSCNGGVVIPTGREAASSWRR